MKRFIVCAMLATFTAGLVVSAVWPQQAAAATATKKKKKVSKKKTPAAPVAAAAGGAAAAGAATAATPPTGAATPPAAAATPPVGAEATPAPQQNAAAAPAEQPKVVKTDLYTVADGTMVDKNTMNGFRAWRAAACDRCHGANQEGLVGPSLVESLKKLTKEEFVVTVRDGRLEKGMQSFGTNKQVMDNMDNLYAYLKGRSDGAITRAKVSEMP